MDAANLRDFAEQYSDYVHKNYFSDIGDSYWDLYQINGNRYAFGYEPTVHWWNLRSNREHNILFYLDFDYGLNAFRLSVSRKFENEISSAKAAMDDFSDYLKSRSFDLFVRPENAKDIFSLIPTGERSEKVLEIVKELPKEYFNTYRFSQMNFEKHLLIDLYLNVDNLSVDIACEGFVIHNMKKLSDFEAFIERVNSEIDEMKKIENEVIGIIEKYDVTCYFDNGVFYIFNERVPFHFSKVFQSGKERYRAKFGKNYNVNLKLDKLAEIIQNKANDYIKKKRVKAVMNGSSRNVFNKFLFKLYERHIDSFSYRYEADSKMTYDELNNILLPFINEAEAVKLSDEYLQFFKLHLRTQKKGNRIDKGFLFGDIYAFISPSKHFFIHKEEFEQYDVSKHKWRTKEDREKAGFLNEFVKKKATIR